MPKPLSWHATRPCPSIWHNGSTSKKTGIMPVFLRLDILCGCGIIVAKAVILVKIQVLIENITENPDLHSEHGLSLYIETNGMRILFDAGQSELFAENAEKLGVNLADADVCILSHGHYDHGGGLLRFMELNDHAPVYMNRNAFGDRYSSSDKYIGLDERLKNSGRIVFTDDDFTIAPNIRLMTCNEKKKLYPMSAQGLMAVVDGKLVSDDFRHEQYLVVEENGKRIVFSGCSHKGILNIVKWMQPDVLIGGFHFKKLNPAGDGRAMLAEAAEKLARGDTKYYTNHCTGLEQFVFLREIMGDRLAYLSVGETLEI